MTEQEQLLRFARVERSRLGRSATPVLMSVRLCREAGKQVP